MFFVVLGIPVLIGLIGFIIMASSLSVINYQFGRKRRGEKDDR